MLVSELKKRARKAIKNVRVLMAKDFHGLIFAVFFGSSNGFKRQVLVKNNF